MDRLAVPSALLVKLLLVLALVFVARHWPADPVHTGPREAGTPEWVWQLSRGWDSLAYQELAVRGYHNDFTRAFPPGYPALIRLARPLVGTAQGAAWAVTNACSLLALLVFLGLARRYAQGRGVALALLLFACMPGELAFGSVAYSEGPFLLLSLLGWMLYLRAERSRPRHLGWLALASLLFAASVLVRHLGAPVFVMLLLVEGRAVWRAGPGDRGRALLEAVAALWAATLVAAWLVYAERAHGLSTVSREQFAMELSFLGGLPGLFRLGAAPEYIVQAALAVPLAVALILRLRRVDGRLALLSALMLLLALSTTGVAAQSTGRYVWSVWPLALAGLALEDRVLGWGLCGLLFLLSLQGGAGHVLGTSML